MSRHRYTQDDLSKYFDRISLPAPHRIYDVSPLSDGSKLAFLNLLQKHHLVKVPWENLVQHYSWHKVVNVKPKHLFNEIVGNPGRGGYCMQVNYFYHLVLYSLNFDVYMAGSRIYHSDAKKYGGWTHVVNIIRIGKTRYLADGGFGGQGPTYPLPLAIGVSRIQISPAEMRVVYEPIPNNLDQSQRVWIYEHRLNQTSPWIPMYCFTDLEFTPEDVEAMNFEPWLDKQAFFTHKVVAVRFATSKEIDGADGPGSPGEDAFDDGEIDSSITINQNTLKWRRHGEKLVSITFETDQQRVDALRKYFGITLTEQDCEGIENTAAQIAVGAMGVDGD